MNAAVENMEQKESEFIEEHETGDHSVASAKDLSEQEDESSDNDSGDESTSSESSSDELAKIIRWSKRRSFADRGGGDADVTYDSDWSTDTVIVNERPSNKEALASPKDETVLCDEFDATVIKQEKRLTVDQQLDSLCEQMKEMKMEHQDDDKSVQKSVDQVTSSNMFKRSSDNDDLDLERGEKAIRQKQKKQIAHEMFQEWLQAEYRRCDGENTERTMLCPEEIVPGH
ncbi:protein phosphatase inhibitor 2-like isoform X2 [Anopheles aquasalis]|nr:protein phosphatase inhibitor 2-like isoform X2 [Anopheles aquasalis]